MYSAWEIGMRVRCCRRKGGGAGPSDRIAQGIARRVARRVARARACTRRSTRSRSLSPAVGRKYWLDVRHSLAALPRSAAFSATPDFLRWGFACVMMWTASADVKKFCA